MIFTFSHPTYLFLLLSIPVLIFLHFITLKTKRQRALRFANFEAIERIKGVELYSKNIVVLVLSILICSFISLSLSGMSVQREGSASVFSYVIAIDSSRSMEASDFPPSRLESAKETARDFIDSLPQGARVGAVSFSGNSLIEEEVTGDKNLVKGAIGAIEISSIGGTDLYEAVITSANLLRGEEKKSLVLISDGQSNVGNLDEAINYAKENNLVINTIGIGTSEGETSYGLTKFDEDSLKSLSYNTGGKFFSAGSKEELSDSFSQIIELKIGTISVELKGYLLILSILLTILEYFLINTKYKTIP